MTSVTLVKFLWRHRASRLLPVIDTFFTSWWSIRVKVLLETAEFALVSIHLMELVRELFGVFDLVAQNIGDVTLNDPIIQLRHRSLPFEVVLGLLIIEYWHDVCMTFVGIRVKTLLLSLNTVPWSLLASMREFRGWASTLSSEARLLQDFARKLLIALQHIRAIVLLFFLVSCTNYLILWKVSNFWRGLTWQWISISQSLALILDLHSINTRKLWQGTQLILFDNSCVEYRWNVPQLSLLCYRVALEDVWKIKLLRSPLLLPHKGLPLIKGILLWGYIFSS